MANPDQDVAAQLAAAGLGLVVGTNLFTAGPQQVQAGVPSQAVFCVLYGGYGAPVRYFNGALSSSAGTEAREPRVMVYVRSSRQDYGGGLTLARAVKAALHDVTPPAGYDWIRVEEQEPIFLYQTDNAEFVFSMSCHLWYDG